MNNIINTIIKIGHQLYQRNMVAAFDGNISYRHDNNNILITCSGCAKGELSRDDFASITIDNDIRSGQPSSERLLHLAIYQHCPTAKAVIHAHPPYATAWSLCQHEQTTLPNQYLSESILAHGDIPIAPFAMPGGPALAESILNFLPQHKIIILAHHGALTWGEDLAEAYRGMERLEHSAQTLYLAHQLGAPKALPDEQLKALKKLRLTIGNKLL